MTLPGVRAYFPDGGLAINPPADVGDSILVIGTSEDGPMNEPVPIRSVDGLKNVFGSFGKGTLVRGVYEVMNGTASPVDVRGMRVGNGQVGTLEVHEANARITSEFESSAGASGIADRTFAVSGYYDNYIAALKMTAKYPGSKYNRFTLRQDLDRNPASNNFGRTCVIVYNPFTGQESSYSYDHVNLSNTSVDVRTVNELVDAINSDPNMNEWVSAETSELVALYEICLSGGVAPASPSGCPRAMVVPASGAYKGAFYHAQDIMELQKSLLDGAAVNTVWTSNGKLKRTDLYLHHITTASDLNGDGIPDAILQPLPENGVPPVLKFGPIGGTWAANIPTAGNGLKELKYVYEIAMASGEVLPTAGKDYADLKYIPINRNDSQDPYGVTGNTIINFEGLGNGTSQYKQVVRNGLVGTSSDGITSTFTFLARLEPELLDFKGVADGTAVSIPDTEYDIWIDWKGVRVKLNPLTGRIEPTEQSSFIKTRVYETIAGITSETRKPATLSWINGTGTVAFTNADDLPSAGTIITIDYASVAGTLTEFATRTSVEATRGNTYDFENYFVAGDQVYFGGPHDTDIAISYEYKRIYDIPGDVSISDAELGKIVFTNEGKQPQIDRRTGTRIGLNYTYRPEWIEPSGTVAMGGGSNGTNMTNAQLKTALSDAYENLVNYEVDIVVPMGAHLDGTIEEYSIETGILAERNAGFHTQLADLLEKMSQNVGEAIGVMGVDGADSNSVSDVARWVRRLTVPDAYDPLRAANFMPLFNSKWVQVVAAEPAISTARLGVPAVDYYSDGVATYAALIASLPANLATTNKYIGRSLLGLRHKLSRAQLSDLLSLRYVPFMMEPSIGPVAVKDVTAAPVGSDYDRLTTLRISKLVASLVRTAARPFIGDVNSAYKRNALHTSINAALSRLTQAEDQYLRAYDFTVTSTPEQQRRGIIVVKIDMVPVFSIDTIEVYVYLHNAL